MSQDKEFEIQMQFLEEATDYLNTLESVLLGIDGSNRIDIEKINAAMRAAHSIKGGAAMMGFRSLSDLAHRLEDSFKVLKTRKNIDVDTQLQSLLLSGVDWLRQIVDLLSEGNQADEQWLATFCYPVFNELHERLGDPAPEDASTILSPEDGQDIIPMLFETEVEGCLQRLEGVVADKNQPCLKEEVAIMAQELGGLGEMLQLEAFTQLCQSVSHYIETYPDRAPEIAQAALDSWRRSQALVLLNQWDILPNTIELANAVPMANSTPVETPYDEETQAAIAQFLSTSDAETVYDEETEAAIAQFLASSEPVPIYDEETEAAFAQFLGTSNTDSSEFLEQQYIEQRLLEQEYIEQQQVAPVAEDINTDTKTVTSFIQNQEEETPQLIEAWQPTEETWLDRDLIAASLEEVGEYAMGENAIAQTEAVFSLPEISAYPVERKEATTTTRAAESTTENFVRVPSRQLEQINDLFGELVIQRNGLNLQMERLRKLIRSLGQRVQVLDRENQQLRAAYDKIATGASVPSMVSSVTFSNSDREITVNDITSNSRFDSLEMDSYNELNSLSQEVMETIVQVQEVTTDIQISLDDTDNITRKLNKTSKQLQGKLTQVRMRPLSDIVDRFPRALRDLNVEYGKNAQLKIDGGNTLIERSILEALNEPLMHLLRNAFDHGIEDPASRRAAAKSEQALIEIKASHRSNRTIITMRDDGRGIPLDKIRARALAMGLDESLLSQASDEELLSLIFEPGFSTSDKVTALSGRGVGMDVVRNNLKQIRGDIKVDTKPGEGTTFTLSVPFTLSVARVLLVENNRMLIAFPTDVVGEIFLLPEDKVETKHDGEVLNWQGNTFPLIRLSRYLEFNCPRYDNPELETPPAINAPSILIINQGNQPIALLVDCCWGEAEVAIRQVEGFISLPDGFSNCTILGDGRVVALVNTNELLYWISTSELAPKNNQLPSAKLKTAFLTPSGQKPVEQINNQKGTILIVDDSINVRRFLALTLEKGGFQVEQAKDGQDALEKLQGGLQVQAIICDIEMPRLDGYGFLGRVKANTELKQLPVAMLTSRSSNKHRQLAMQLGATAYFSKPYNEQELLRSLEEIIFPMANAVTPV